MKPPWLRKKALPRVPRRSIRVLVKVIEVGGTASSYRRSHSYTLRDKSFKEVREFLDAMLPRWITAKPLRTVPPKPTSPTDLTTPPSPA